MKRLALLVQLITLGLFQASRLYSQNYTWLRGSSTVTMAGVYGTQGVAAAGNDPGARHGACTWKDSQGNLWLFGGEGLLTNSEWFNDLWKYSPATNQWTWVKGSSVANQPGVYGTQGVAALANTPGAREFAMCWTDASGNFWLFGGDGFGGSPMSLPVAKLSDLWKYDPVTNMWTWMKGPSTTNATGIFGTQNVAAAANNPGGRYWGATWVDNAGKFWLFGGRGYGAANNLGRLNDLWKYDPLNNQWTWVGGSQAIGSTGVYGTQGVPSAGNFPGARECPGHWVSINGKLIMFGGQGYTTNSSIGYLNDMWEYNTSTGMWTWINGPNAINQTGIYGTPGIPSTANMPGARLTPACWTDATGNYWLFGGEGFGAVAQGSYLNDLFRFNPTTSEWTWLKGSNQILQVGVYGTQGVPAPANTPGARGYNTWWTNVNDGYLWLFGGLGLTSLNTPQESMNDLWKFKLPCNPDSAVAAQTPTVCSGGSISLTAYNQLPSPVAWYTTPNGGTSVGSGSLFTTPALTTQLSNTVYTYYAQANSCTTEPLAAVNITVFALPQVSITGASSVCPSGISTLTAAGAQSYSWSTGSNSTSITFTFVAGNVFTVSGTSSAGCLNTAIHSVGLFNLPNITASTPRPTICRNEAVLLTAGGGSVYLWNSSTYSASILVTPTITTVYTVTGTDANGCSKTVTLTQFVASCAGFAKEVTEQDIVSVFPNPAKGEFKIRVNAAKHLILFNELGQSVFEQELAVGDNIIGTELCKGVYIYTINHDHEPSIRGKILIE